MTIVPVYNITVLPNAKVYLRSEDYTKLAGKSPEEGERIIFLILKKEEAKNNVQENSFEKIGVSGTITKSNENGFVVVKTKSRVNIDEIHINTNHTIELNITKRPDLEDLDADTEREHLNQLKAGILRTIEGHQWTEMAKHFIASWTSMEELTAGMSPWLSIPADEKYHFLETDSREERMALMEKAVYEYLELNRLSSEAETAQEAEYRKTYREAAIKKQMEYLQKELDEMHPEDISDVRRLEEKINDSGMNETAFGEAKKILNRMKQSGSNNAEYGMLNDYLEFMTSLSWKKPDSESISLKDAEDILNADHFGMKKVKERIIQQIAVMDLNKQQAGSILLFVGAPGTGKTSVGQSIAKALNRKYVRVSLGGVRDEADIRGHRRTYIGAMPGRIMDGIQKSGVSNPVMVLDEIDKLSSSYQGDPASALLEVLDPEQNSTFTDHYMNVPYDLSNVMFICTAN
ncbi:MAG: AAA family ATPase, partial [Eubacteriales bacterium]|nr:AAA family ATPase [Eubacteriales bacterium]